MASIPGRWPVDIQRASPHVTGGKVSSVHIKTADKCMRGGQKNQKPYLVMLWNDNAD